MNILLDTNIIIPLEDTGRILDASFAELRKLATEQQHCLYVHPLQIDDINRDKDKDDIDHFVGFNIRGESQLRFQTYDQLVDGLVERLEKHYEV